MPDRMARDESRRRSLPPAPRVRAEGEWDMYSGRRGYRILLGAILLALTGCGETAEHPDPSKYDYLYSDGAFVSPYKAFPTGRAREGWQCYDKAAARAFDCTFVRGGFEHFQYIFRPRT